MDIVIPTCNEGSGILPVLESLAAKVATPFRVLVCFDRDDDSTLPALDRAPRNLTVIRVRNPGRGPHAAVLSGFAASDAPAVLVYPADDVENAARIDGMVARVQRGSAIVCASRFMPGGQMVGCPWPKAILVRSANFALRHFARLPTHDATNGLRMFAAHVVREIAIESTMGFTYSIELLVKVHRLGWPIEEVPVIWRERTAGRSRFRALRWLPAYLRWLAYGLATTWFRLGPESVRLKHPPVA